MSECSINYFSSALYTHVQSLLHVIACSGVILYIIHYSGLEIEFLLSLLTIESNLT